MAQKIAIYPGRFQPPHKGHLKAYETIKQMVGSNNAYIATSDVINDKSPLSFQEKQQIWSRHGVPIDKIVKVVNPYRSDEITHKFDPKNTIILFFLSQKDAQRISYTKKDGSPAYLQPYQKNKNNLKTFDQHSYVFVISTQNSTAYVNGRPITGTAIRESLGSPKYTENQKKKFFQNVFGWFDIALFDLMVDKFSKSNTLNESKFKRLIKAIINELFFPEPGGEVDKNDLKSMQGKEDSEEKETEEDPEMDRKSRELARKQLDVAKKKREFQLTQRKYRKQGVEQDTRDIDATDSEIDVIRSKI